MRLNRFQSKFEAIERRYVPKDGPVPRVPIVIQAPAWQWVKNEARIAAKTNNAVNLLSYGIVLAGFRLLADRYRMNVQLMTPNEEEVAPPDWQAFQRARQNVVGPLMTIPPAFSILSWAYRRRNIRPETMVHNGILLLGALAAMPEDSALTVVEGSDYVGAIPLLNVAGAEPYPPPPVES